MMSSASCTNLRICGHKTKATGMEKLNPEMDLANSSCGRLSETKSFIEFKDNFRINFGGGFPALLFSLLILICSYKTGGSLVINKCCDVGMIFDNSLKCVKIPRGNFFKDFYWFPTDSIVDAITLKVQPSQRNFYLSLLKQATVKFGKKPECDNTELDSTSFTEDKPLFNFLLYNNSEMRVYVSSNKTVHDHRNAYKFSIAQKKEEEKAEMANKLSLKVGKVLTKFRTFPLKNICVDAVLNSNRYRILICPCDSSVCIRKCCKDLEYYNVTAQNCFPITEIPGNVQKWRPKHFEVENIYWKNLKHEFSSQTKPTAHKNVTNMLFILVFLSWLNILGLGADLFQINKCCPRGQKFDENIDCVLIEENEHKGEKTFAENDPKGLFSWFPLESVVNASTLKIHEHHRDRYLKLLSEKFTVNFGQTPVCSSEHTKQVAYFKSDVIEFYNFILYENSTLRIYVSKPGSLNNPSSEAIHFASVQEEPEWKVNDLTQFPIDSLRTFPLEDACVDLGYMGIHFLVYCPCRTSICIRKCCVDGEFFNATSDKCESFEGTSLKKNNWRPAVNGVIDQYYLLSDTFPSCENPLLLKVPDHAYKSCNRFNKESDNDFVIYNNGSVKVRKYKNPYESHQYCGEVTWHENGKIYEQNLILCSALKQNESSSRPIKSIIYGTLLIIGGICLLITVAVSLYLPELRRRMHNKIALSHHSSLMVAYFTWALGQLTPDLGGKSCMLIALIIQFTFLGSFFWLNVMCLDISMTFSATRSLGERSNLGEYKKFIYYCIYSWGSTTVISIVTMIMEFLPDVPYDFLKPGFACSCGFNTANASILIYFYGPMSLLLIFNLILFVFTTIKIMSVQRQTAILHKTDSNTIGGSPYQSDKQRYDLMQWLILYAKLFLLMGLTWITEIISWAVGGPDYYWYFSDILNLLRAVFIFILFICKRPVLESLKRKLKCNSAKEGCSRSMSDVISTSTSLRDSRLRSSVNNSNKRKESVKVESEAQKLIAQKPTCEILPKNGRVEESCM